MKHFAILLLLVLTNLTLAKAQDTLSTQNDAEQSKIKISSKFMSELDNAFSFTAPIQAPIEVKDETLTTKQLHRWVGDPLNLKDCCKWDKSRLIHILGLEKLSRPLSAPTEGVGYTLCIDVNALAKYLRPSEIKIQQMRDIADKNRKKMDKFFPISGLPNYSILDTHVADTCKVRNEPTQN